MECNTKKRQGRPRMNLAMRVKKDSRKAGVSHEELQEMAEDRQRWKEGKSGSKDERKSEASAGEMILKKCSQQCDGGASLPPSRIIHLMIQFRNLLRFKAQKYLLISVVFFLDEFWNEAVCFLYLVFNSLPVSPTYVAHVSLPLHFTHTWYITADCRQ